MKVAKLLVLPALFWASGAIELEDLFQLKASGPGACGQSLPIVRGWLADTILLVNEVNGPLRSLPITDLNLRRNLASWFKIRTTDAGLIHGSDQDKFQTVQVTFQALQTFLSTAGNPNTKPLLFCDSTWLVETEDLYDVNGNLVRDPGDPARTANLRTFPIPAQGDGRFNVIDAMHDGTPPNWDYYAYYSSDLRSYVVEPAEDRYNGNPRSWCNGEPNDARFALTGMNLARPTITLCPNAFTDLAEPHESIAIAIRSLAARMQGNDLVLASPRSLTLLHELVHLTVGPANTPDRGFKPTQCLQLAGTPATMNPDSYAYMAWSYYLTRNGNPTFDWSSGIGS